MNSHNVPPRAWNAQELNLPQLPQPDVSARLLDGIEDTARGILAKHGIAAFEMTKKAAAFHEAGHAIVGTHEGMRIKSVSIESRSMPGVAGMQWTGFCLNADGWTSGPHTTAQADLSRARYVLAGYVAEAATNTDMPGSSIEERGLATMLVNNATVKMLGETPFATLAEAIAAQPPGVSEERQAYLTKLGDEQVWDRVAAALRTNWDLFHELAQELYRRHKVKGGRLQKILGKVKKVVA
jgi:hypothetical protein